MKNKLLVLTLTIAILLSAFAFPFDASAATCEEIDGKPTAFVTSFGRMTYNGSPRTAFKTFSEGVSALENGGRLVFSGSHTYSEKSIGNGSGLELIGQGTLPTGNIIKFTEKELSAASDLYFDIASYHVEDGTTLNMNGHNLTTGKSFSTYYVPIYNTGTTTYYPYISVVSGNADKPYGFDISSGHFATLALASGAVTASSTHKISGGTIERLVVGNLDGESNADITLDITGGEIGELVVGAVNGKMNGAVKINIKNATINKISVGAYGKNASFSGSAAIVINKSTIGELCQSGDGKTDASVVYFATTLQSFNIDEGAKYDTLLGLTGGSFEPIYDQNGKIHRIACYDTFGCPAKKLVNQGGELLPENGSFKLPEGKFIGEIVSALDFGYNENASFVSGYTDGSFKPDGKMTRAEAVTLVSRIISSDPEIISSASLASTLEDVAETDWFSPNVSFFYNVGLLEKLVDNGKFRPNESITRAEFAQLIYNIERLLTQLNPSLSYNSFIKLAHNISVAMPNAEGSNGFTDVDYKNTYGNAIYSAVANGYVTGYVDGSFKPDGSITRAEVVTIVNRILGRIPKGTSSKFNDVESHWASGQISAACTAENEGWSKPTGIVSNGNTAAQYVDTLINAKNQKSLAKMMTTHLFKIASQSVAAADIPENAKAELKSVVDSARNAQSDSAKRTITGSADDQRNYIYSHLGGPYVREATIESKKPDTEPVTIVQITDTHFNLVNELDEQENNPAIMSTKEHRVWLRNGASISSSEKAMNYARLADQTVVTGDILDYLSHGCKQLTIEQLFRVDTDILACLGNHESTRVMQGTVADNTSLQSRRDILSEFWIHDISYSSKLLKDKVICVALDNGNSTFWEDQYEKLAADIKLARENDYIILLFYHIPLCTKNPNETEVKPISRNDTEVLNGFSSGIGAGKPNDATKNLYELITTSADVIKGAFCGHMHSDFYTEIVATTPDGQAAVIPQYILTANVYNDIGHVMKITVK